MQKALLRTKRREALKVFLEKSSALQIGGSPFGYRPEELLEQALDNLDVIIGDMPIPFEVDEQRVKEEDQATRQRAERFNSRQRRLEELQQVTTSLEKELGRVEANPLRVPLLKLTRVVKTLLLDAKEWSPNE